MAATGGIYFANTCYVFKQPSAIPCIPQQGPRPGNILNIRTKAQNSVQGPTASRQLPILAPGWCRGDRPQSPVPAGVTTHWRLLAHVHCVARTSCWCCPANGGDANSWGHVITCQDGMSSPL